MQLFANLLLYISLSIGIGRFFQNLKQEDGSPTLKWYVVGLIIGGIIGLSNALLLYFGFIFGFAFRLDMVFGSLMGGLGTGLLIGIPIGLLTAYDMSKRFTFIDGWLLFFKLAIMFIVIGGTISSLAVPKYSSEQWTDFLVFGVAQGSIYALIALGYTLVYGILFMINFAHGEVFMAGSFTAFFAARALDTPAPGSEVTFWDSNPILSLFIIMAISIITSTVVAVTLERIAYRPLRNAPRLVPLITAIGASFFLQYTFRGFYGSGVESYPDFTFFAGDMTIGDLMLYVAMLLVGVGGGLALIPVYKRLKKTTLAYPYLSWVPFIVSGTILLIVAIFLVPVLASLFVPAVDASFPISAELAVENEISVTSEYAIPISRKQFVVINASILMMIGLYNFVQKTKIGKAMRAVAEDKEVAALMGIDVDRIITFTFAMGAVMAGVAGILYALMFRQVNFFMGFVPGLKAFTAAVLGGIGHIPGAMIGGLFLGIFESLGPSLFLEGLGIASPYQLKDAIAFTMLVLVLLFRPTGIMGVELNKKKA